MNTRNVVLLEALLLDAKGSCGGDPVLRPAQAVLLAEYLSRFGVLVPSSLTELQSREIGGISDDPDPHGGVVEQLERIAKGNS